MRTRAGRVLLVAITAAASLVAGLLSPASAYARPAGSRAVPGRASASAPVHPVSIPAEGYRAVGTDGGVFDFGTNRYLGSLPGLHVVPAAPVVSMAPTPTGLGYWLVARDGGIFSFGDARFQGSLARTDLASPIVAMAPTKDGKGYWLVGADGGVFAFGDATFYGSLGGVHLAAPIVGMAATPDSRGYWLVASDGGVFSFGDAAFYGSLGGVHLAAPIVAIASAFTGSGSTDPIAGYWLLASDGGVFAFGAPFHGSLPGIGLATTHAIGITPTVDNGGYWIGTADGTVRDFGDAPNLGDFHTAEAALGYPKAVLAGSWLQLTTVASPGAAGGGGSPAPPPTAPPLGAGSGGPSPSPTAPVVTLAYGPGTTSQMPSGTTAEFSATVTLSGQPDPATQVTFAVAGANQKTATATTDPTGVATFSYVGAASGSDTVTATAANGASASTSNPLTVVWSASVSLADTSQVQGDFFAEPAGQTSFVATPADKPAFSQAFPDVAFNPPAGLLPVPPGAPTPATVPFTDVVTDAGGSYAGVMPAQADGFQAGAQTPAGDLTNFDAVLKGSLSIGQGGYLSLGVISGDGFVLGVGGGATGYSGQITAGPASGKTAFDGYTVVAANDTCLDPTANNHAPQPSDYPVTIHLPAAGSYPYEIDYFSCDTQSSNHPLRSLVLRVEGLSQNPPASPTVYFSYADTSRQANDLFHYFPYPWVGTPGVDFEGCAPASNCNYDAGAIRVDNTTNAPITVDKLVVSFQAPASGYFDSTPTPYSCVYDIWAPDAPSNVAQHGEPAVVLQPGQTAIYTQEVGGEGAGCNNTDGQFDTSDVPYSCRQSGIVPQVALTIDGSTSTYDDTTQILNSGGVDKAGCVPAPLNNESSQWTRISGPGTGADVPLPPQAGLSLQPTQDLNGGALTQTVDHQQTFTATATSADGTNLAGVPVTFVVTGTNPQRHNATTDNSGQATFSYNSTASGADTVSATASYQGLEMASGQVSLDWQIPAPGQTSGSGGTAGQDPPALTITSPADAANLTSATPLQATITPVAGQTITGWTASLAGSTGETTTTIGSGSGTPPATLATLDPAHLPPGSYTATVSATASGGGVNTESVTFQVGRVAKVGQISETYQDDTETIDGFPISVDRTYSSFDKTTGDFGVGWRLSLSQVSAASNGTLGAGGWSPQPDSCSLFGCTYRYQSTSAHTVTVTLQGGQQEVFNFSPTGGFGPLFFLGGAGAFTPRPGTGTTGTLAPVGDPGVYYGYDGNLYTTASAGIDLYTLTEYLYTDAHGDQYLISTRYGLLGERQPNGDCVAYTPSGVFAYTGATAVTDNGNGNGGCTNGAGTYALAITRDGSGRITAITDHSNNVFKYTYDPTTGDLTSVDLAGNGTDTYTYDANHDLLSQAGPGGPQLTQHYDANGDVTSITDANGNTYPVSINSADRTETITDPLGTRTTVYTYDPAGDLVSEQQIAGGQTRTTSYTYNALGDLTSKTDPLGNTTKYAYDANGNETAITDALGDTTTLTVDAAGQGTSRTDPLGRTSSATYNSAGELLSITKPSGAGYKLGYDTSGDLTSITDPLGNTFSLGYAPAGDVNSITDPLGNASHAAYDPAGDLTASQDANGNTTSYAYNASHQVTTLYYPAGGSMKYTYDAAGNVASTTDSLGNTTSYAYDPAGELTGITDAVGGTVQLSYDADGNLVSLTDPDGHKTTYTYDAFGERVSATNGDKATTSYVYDADGRVISTTDATGQKTTYTYDGNGRLTTRTAGTSTTTWKYDPAGELVGMVDASGTTTYTYDADGEVTAVDSPAGTIGYTYDSDGRRSTMTLPGGGTISYSYDKDGNLIGETGLGQTVQFSYDASGRLSTETLPNGVTNSYTYDPNSNINQVTSSKGGTTLQSYSYFRNAAGNPTTVRYNDGSATTFSYDSLGRVLGASGPGASSYSYAYDAAGNITSSTANGVTTSYSYDAAGQLSSAGGQPVTTDANGNITAADGQTMTWDALGQLTATTSGGTATGYTYSGSGLPAKVSTGGSSAAELWDQVDPQTGALLDLPQPPGTGATAPSPSAPSPGSATNLTSIGTASAASGPQLISDGTNSYLDANGRTIGQISTGGTASWYLPDGLGSTTAVTDSSGAVSATTAYSPFGQVAASSGTQPPFGFTGQQQAAGGLVYLRARYLDPAIGQFLTSDSLEPSGPATMGYNRYAYAGDDPTLLTDPSGHDLEEGIVGRVTTYELYINLLGCVFEGGLSGNWTNFAGCVGGSLLGALFGGVFGKAAATQLGNGKVLAGAFALIEKLIEEEVKYLSSNPPPFG